MRLIDADWLLDVVENIIDWDTERDRNRIIHQVRELTPIITPEPHWIPVTESCECDLMDDEEVLVFQKDGTINGQIRHAMFYDFNGKKKFVTWEEGITIYNVLAYMSLPEPYKGVTE